MNMKWNSILGAGLDTEKWSLYRAFVFALYNADNFPDFTDEKKKNLPCLDDTLSQISKQKPTLKTFLQDAKLKTCYQSSYLNRLSDRDGAGH